MQPEVVAQGTVAFRPDKFEIIGSERLPKGPFLEVARLASFLAAKRDSFFGDRLFITHIEVDHHWGPSDLTFRVRLVAEGDLKQLIRRAWFAAFVACLTVYDMVKAVDPDAVIENVAVVEVCGSELPVVEVQEALEGSGLAFSPTVVVKKGRLKTALGHPGADRLKLRWLREV